MGEKVGGSARDPAQGSCRENDTQSFSSPSLVCLSPSGPAKDMFTFNTKPERRLGEARPNRSYCGSSYETGGLVHHAAHVSDTEGAHTSRHERLLSPRYEMSVVWDEPCLFSVIEDATPIESSDSYQGEADSSRFPLNPDRVCRNMALTHPHMT